MVRNANDPDLLTMLVEVSPRVVSFHFGLPAADALSALRARSVLLLATAINLEETRAIEAAGLDVIVAQAFEAGKHRAVFNPARRSQINEQAILGPILQPAWFWK